MAGRSMPGRRSTPKGRQIFRRLVARVPRRKPFAFTQWPTVLYFQAQSVSNPGIHRGTNSANLRGTAAGWDVKGLNTTRSTGSSVNSVVTSVTGPTGGIETTSNSFATEYITLPLAAPVTIAGTIKANLWASQGSVSPVGAAINVIIERLDAVGAIISTIGQSSNIVELDNVSRPYSMLITPTSTSMLRGERLRVRVYFDDTSSNMTTGISLTFASESSAPNAQGDSHLSFSDVLTFQTTDPSGTQMFLTTTAGPAVGANDELEMWTSRGGGSTTAATTLITGWTTPIQWKAGSVVKEWYSKPLTAFTLSGLVKANIRASESGSSANASVRVEVAVCDGDGTNVTVFGASNITNSASLGGAIVPGSFSGELTTTDAAVLGWIGGQDISVTNGQRIRLRLFVDDSSTNAMNSGLTATLSYNGTTASAAGDTWIQLPQSVTEYVGINVDLAISVDASDTTSPPAGYVQFHQVSVDNSGPSSATNVVATITSFSDPSSGLRYVSYSAPSQGTYDPVTGVWTIGTLASGGSASLFITMRSDGSGILAGSVTSDPTDTFSGNDTASTPIGVGDGGYWGIHNILS